MSKINPEKSLISQVQVKGEAVCGVGIDGETRCCHYCSDLDVVAIRFYCCRHWYPCYECHVAIADHSVIVWPRENWVEKAILCGVCGHQLIVHEYLDDGSSCPMCQASFNPSCRFHYHLYFES